MGQKVNPIGLRLGIIKTWGSIWYSSPNKFSNLMSEDFKIRDFLNHEVEKAGVSEINIERSSNQVTINLNVAKPGIVIGKKGNDIDKLKSKLSDITGKEIKLNILGVKKIELDAQLVANSIAKQLEKRVSFRRAMKKAVQNCLKMGGRGIRVNCSGRIGGAEIARTEWYREGRVPLHTLRANIDYKESTARTAYGAIGVKVWIYKGDVIKNNENNSN